MIEQSGVPEIEGFTFLRELGRGAVATVWEARQHDPDRVVAIKLLHEDITGNPEEVEDFYAEARRAAELDHENIVTVFEVGCQHGVYYYVMELASGYDTAKWLHRKGHLKQDDVLTIAESVAMALDYAERKIGLIHCDIKPGNIMVDGDGTVRITDLGIARLARGSNADDGYICGTPSFMSPEQAQGGKLDARADIYSLGATMYTLLTGHRLFDGRSDADIMEAQCREYVSDLREFNPDVSYQLAVLIAQMLSKSIDERPRDWTVVIEGIRRVMKGELPLGAVPGDSTMKLVEYAKSPTEEQFADKTDSSANSSADNRASRTDAVVSKTEVCSTPADASARSTARSASAAAFPGKDVRKDDKPVATAEKERAIAASGMNPQGPVQERVAAPSHTPVTAVVKRENDAMGGFVVRTAVASAAVFAVAYFVTRYFMLR